MVKNLCNVLFLISKLSQKLKGKLSKLTISQFLKETVSGIFDHAFYRAIVIKLSQLMETVSNGSWSWKSHNIFFLLCKNSVLHLCPHKNFKT